jgi:hypothetical protein
MSIEKI